MTEHVHGPDCAHGHSHGGTPIKLGAVGGKEPCPCGSGKKYKHCCYPKDRAAEAASAQAAKPAAKSETDSETESAAPADGSEAQAPRHGGPKAPVISRASAVPPRKPPQGVAKALGRRSGHR